MRPFREALSGVIVLLLLAIRPGGAAEAVPPQTTAAPPPRILVLGRATFDGSERRATVVWVYELGGERLESTVPPGRMEITRLSSNVEKVGVVMPQEMFAIKIGPDLQRIFAEPIIMDTDQATQCTCGARNDCVGGNVFTCEIEGFLLQTGPGGAAK